MEKVVFVALVAAFAGFGMAQCPDTGRTKIEQAGLSNESTRNCASFSITVLGFTFATPAQCRDSYVQRLDDEFACQGNPAPGLCCRNTGKARIKIYGPSNTCPQPPAALPDTLQAAAAIVQCTEPKLTRETFNTSAQEQSCASTPQCTERARKQSGQPQHAHAYGSYVGWWGNPDSQLPPADATILAGWMVPMEDVLPENLATPMAALWAAVPPIPFVDGVVAEVQLRNRMSDGSYADFRYVIRGAAAADGRFSVRSTSKWEGPGEVHEDLETDLSFDHKALYVGSVGEDFYGAHPRTMGDFVSFLMSSAGEVMPIIDWLKGPVWIPRSSMVSFSSEPAVLTVGGVDIPVIRVTEHYPGSSLLGWRIYDIDMAQAAPRILRTTTKDEMGRLLMRREFADHRVLQGGQLRPHSMITTRFVPGSELVDTEVRLTVVEARPCAADDIRAWRRSSDVNKWYLFNQ